MRIQQRRLQLLLRHRLNPSIVPAPRLAASVGAAAAAVRGPYRFFDCLSLVTFTQEGGYVFLPLSVSVCLSFP